MVLTAGETAAVVLGSIVGVLLVLMIVLKVYAKLTCGVCKCDASLKGKTVILTGATSGIGMETARDLARRGARLILACRDTEAGYRFKDKIALESDNDYILVKKLDLASEASIRAFAEDMKATEDRLDVLIHNAAVAYGFQKLVTADGLDQTMAVNYFGPFLLTHLLIDLLKRSKPSRVVIVGSGMYRVVLRFDPSKLNPIGYWLPFYTYFYSKYAVMMFALELASRLQGQGVNVNTVHPGVQFSGIWRNSPKSFFCFLYAIKWLMKSNVEGAQTTIHCAVSEQLENVTGKYFFDCKEKQLTRQIQDAETRKKLWDATVPLALKPSDSVIQAPLPV